MVFSHSQENMVKKLMDAVTKTGIDAAKTASKRVVQKPPEAMDIWLEIKQLIKLLHLEKQKLKTKKMKDKKSTYHQKKDSIILMTWDCFDTI